MKAPLLSIWEHQAIRNERRLFIIVAAAVLLSRLPFLLPGFGMDADAWRVGLAAREIAQTHRYTASRMPGNPAQEIACSLLNWGAPLTLTGAAALISALTIAMFAVALRRLGSRDILPASLALALTPVIYINSTANMDYLWGLCFMMAALLMILRGGVLGAGLCVGMAIGCRITAAAMLLPLSILIVRPGRQRPTAADFLFFWIPALAVGALWYRPGYHRYGPLLLGIMEHGYPPPAFVLKAALIDVWGPLGLAALGVAAFVHFYRRRPFGTGSRPALVRPPRLVGTAAVLAIALYSGMFLVLPHKAGYLVPLVPFVILLAARVLRRRAFRWLCGLLCLSPFFVGLGFPEIPGYATVPRGAIRMNVAGHPLYLDLLRGPVIQEARGRSEKIATVRRILAAGSALREPSAVIVGSYLPMVQWLLPPGAPACVHYEDLLPRMQMQGLQAQNLALYDVPFQRERELSVYGVDLRAMGSRPLIK